MCRTHIFTLCRDSAASCESSPCLVMHSATLQCLVELRLAAFAALSAAADIGQNTWELWQITTGGGWVGCARYGSCCMHCRRCANKHQLLPQTPLASRLTQKLCASCLCCPAVPSRSHGKTQHHRQLLQQHSGLEASSSSRVALHGTETAAVWVFGKA